MRRSGWLLFFMVLLVTGISGNTVSSLEPMRQDYSGDLLSFELSDNVLTIMAGETMRRVNVPILMYHYVSPLPEDADPFRIDLTIFPERFREHLAYLQASGFQTITLHDLYGALMHGQPLPEKPIILTFDDGYIDHYTYVFPELLRFGFRGTFFVITGMADVGNPRHLNWLQIREMALAGMQMESHTKTHPDLRNREYEFLVYEILGSLESLEAHTGLPARAFSYPAGRYDLMALSVLDQTSVTMAVTTRQGQWHTSEAPLELSRLRISGNLSVAGLVSLLNTVNQ
ncbi:MAG: polysaccharide deacetylase family protein [Chloroflexota bacterium]